MAHDSEETLEERIRRYAQNRYDMRIHHKWKLWETADDDWRAAEELARREFYRHHADSVTPRPEEDSDSDKSTGKRPR